ncbi:MAG: DUF3775 domain-containing protein [Candidatus Electronema sp. V4]|uniref:DUF3775 domain-containing protein n=1 Tax=Candidatus Electronema sp. V4 TaxID=3454756 RepID=UPI004055522B
MRLSVKKVQEIVKLAEQLYPPIHNQESNYLIDDEQKIADALEDTAISIQERKVLCNYIENLPDDERYELIALAWLGRGDAGEAPSDWESLVIEASGYTAEVAAVYLVSKYPLAGYLREGMRKMGMN